MERRILVLVGRDLADEPHRAAHAALASFLPAVAVLGDGAFAADLRGTERLLGPAPRVARRALWRLRDGGVVLAAGIASDAFTARALAERTAPGTVRALAPAEERSFRDALPLDALPLDPRVVEELQLLGIRRAGAFAALPRAAVLDRFGLAAAHAHALARGEDGEALPATLPPERLVASRTWDGAIDAFEPLLFALRAVTDDLGARLAERGLAALRLAARLEREDDHALRFERVVLPPTAEPAALLRSLRWMLEERVDLGRVLGVELDVVAAERAAGRQIGLFAPDGARREDVLGVAAYLRGRLGPHRVLRPRVVDRSARLPERVARLEEVAS